MRERYVTRQHEIGDADAPADSEEQRLPVYCFDVFDPTLVTHGVTARTPRLPLDGNMSYMVGDSPDQVWRNRVAWADAIGFDPLRLVLGRQVHGTRVAIVDEEHAGSGAETVETSIRRVDALVTSTPNLPIGVMAADCVPILIHDPVRGAVAAVHAGWRGTVAGVVGEAISTMRARFGSQPTDLLIALGPSICDDCYQVGEEVVQSWRNSGVAALDSAMQETADGYYFDLRQANLLQLDTVGVKAERIEVSSVCTKCAAGEFFSRRGIGARTGLFTSVIMMKETGRRS